MRSIRRLLLPVLALLLFCGPARAQERVRYDGHKHVRVTVKDHRELLTVLALTDDIWTCTGAGIGTFDIRQSPEQHAALLLSGIEHEVLDHNLQASIDAERARIAGGGGVAAGWFDDYKDYNQVKSYIQGLAAAYPALAKYSVIGKTLEGRDIFALRITGPGDTGARPALFLDGCQHAREWLTPTTNVYIADRLLKQYATDPDLKKLVDTVEFIIVPIVNGDGYVYSWDVDRFWRKNRRPPPLGSTCWGVDTNRNWGYQWGLDNGSSGNPCSETYRGAAPFSEPEPTVIANYVKSIPRIEAYIDFHSFSQLILSPWGYTPNPSPDHATFQAKGADMAAAIKAVHGKTYVYGPGYSTIYPTSGTSPDWAYGSRDIFAWTIEVRPASGGGGFDPPPDQILPTAEECFAAVEVLADWIRDPQTFTLPAGIPYPDAPETAASVDIKIIDGGAAYQPGSGKIYRRIGATGPFSPSALVAVGGGVYRGTLPAADCGETIQFYFEAKTTANQVLTYPPQGAAAPLSTKAAQSVVAYDDACETNKGWTPSAPNDTATSGKWNRMNPQGTSAQPEDDHTPAPGAWCWVTDGNAGATVNDKDVDGGLATIMSPKLDATAGGAVANPEAYISYWRWYSNNQSANPNADSMPVQISGDNGQSWQVLETVSENAGTWVQKTFKVNTFVTPTASIRIRFIARDLGGDSAVEAAIDDVRLTVIGCPAPPPSCYADCDTSGALDIDDFICFQTLVALGDEYADCDQSGGVDIDDFICFQTAFALGCP